jgi:hypothetical protein
MLCRCLVLLFFLSGLQVQAQSVETTENLSVPMNRKGVQLGVHTGPFLVSGVAGVREILPFVGARLSLPFRTWYFETTALSGRAEGTEYHQIDLGLRIDMDYDFIQYFLLVGGDAHYWKRAPSPFREFEYRFSHGWHLGFGFFYPISEVFSFRNDFKINFGPGQSMFVGVGFVYHFETADETNQTAQ